MGATIWDSVAGAREQLRKSENKVADYVLANQHKIPELTISELAAACDVSEATVNRFVKTIGCDKYGEFKVQAARSLLYNVPSNIGPNDSVIDIGHKLMESFQYAVRETLEMIERDQIEQAINLLGSSRKIRVCAMGGSQSIAAAMNCLFAKAGFDVQADNDLYMDFTAISQMNENDALVIISMSGSSVQTLQLAKMAHKKGIHLIAITRSEATPLAREADIVLKTYSLEEPFYGDLIAGKFSQMFLVDLLYIGTVIRNYDVYQKRLCETAEAVKELLTCYNLSP